jgi:glutamine synthetase
VSYWGPEAEFFILNSVRFDQTAHAAFYFIDSEEGIWNSGADDAHAPNLGHRPLHKRGYFPVPPTDKLQDLRSRMVLALMGVGIDVELHHHEVATAGQAEIDIRYGPLTQIGDQMMLFKYIIKNVARQHGYTVTFMPKPIFGDNGSGMHVHQSLWKDGVPLFFSESGYALTSEMCRHYIGGLLAHAPALLAFCAPTTNSYRRLVPGYEAPVALAYSARNRSAACRIPVYNEIPAQKRIEFRCPDPSANPYLAFAAMLMAGLDGIRNKTVPPDPVDVDIYELAPENGSSIKSTPGSLEESLDALAKDHAFLLEGDVFTADVISEWIDYKITNEVKPASMHPTPFDYLLYFDA